MTSSWKKVIGLTLTAVLVVFIIGYFWNTGKQELTLTNKQTPIKSGKNNAIKVVKEMPAATGNVDDIVVALSQESNEEAMTAEGETETLDLIGSDDAVISDFGQSYDEEF